MQYLSINENYIASNVVGQLCVDQASFIYQDLNIDAIFFIPPANTGCAILLYIFMFYVQTCIFFLLVTTLATCSYLLLGEWPSYRIELTRHYYLEGNCWRSYFCWCMFVVHPPLSGAHTFPGWQFILFWCYFRCPSLGIQCWGSNYCICLCWWDVNIRGIRAIWEVLNLLVG